MSRTMTKPKKLRDNRMDETKDERVLPAIGEPHPMPSVELEVVAVTADEVTVTVQPKPRRFVPRPCSKKACSELGNFSYVYHTKTENGYRYHYCECRNCNTETWVQTTKL